MNTLSRYLRVLAAICCFSLFATGCTEKSPEEPQQVVAGLSAPLVAALVARVEGRWWAMERYDYGAAYEYTTPNYRSVFSKSMYSNKFGYDVKWVLTGVDVLTYDAQAAVASVAVRVMSESTKQTTLASGIGAIPTTIVEKWFYIDGEWWNSAK